MLIFEPRLIGDENFTKTDIFHLLDFFDLQAKWNRETLDELEERVDRGINKLQRLEESAGYRGDR